MIKVHGDRGSPLAAVAEDLRMALEDAGEKKTSARPFFPAELL
jgi:hypothetical protein